MNPFEIVPGHNHHRLKYVNMVILTTDTYSWFLPYYNS